MEGGVVKTRSLRPLEAVRAFGVMLGGSIARPARRRPALLPSAAPSCVLEHRAVLDQVQPEAGLLALAAHRRVGQPERRHQVALREHRQTRASILSVLHANGARPLTLCASAISTSQPCRSSVSWTKRAPVIDSTTPRTGSPCSKTRRASLRTPSWSLGTANSSTSSPRSNNRQTSSRLRLKSNPASNMKTGLLELAPRWTLWSASPRRPSLMAVPKQNPSSTFWLVYLLEGSVHCPRAE